MDIVVVCGSVMADSGCLSAINVIETDTYIHTDSRVWLAHEQKRRETKNYTQRKESK